MKKLFYILPALWILSCNGDRRHSISRDLSPGKLNEHQIDSILSEFNFEYDTPQVIDSSDFVIFPITTSLLEKRKVISSSDYYKEEYPRYWNILFYNVNTGESRLLTESKYRISNFSINLKNAGPVLVKSILYEIADSDYDKDGKLSDKDPEQLFISRDDGTGLKKISPADEHLLYYMVIPHSDRLMIKTKRDTNSDLKFDRDDEDIWYMVHAGTDEPPMQVVDAATQKKVEGLYLNQWLMKHAE